MADAPESRTSGSRWPALVTRTSGELLGRRPLPRVIADRAVVFVMGPPGVGKSTVARRLLGPGALALCGQELRAATLHAARHRLFPDALREAPALLLDPVEFMDGRYGAVGLLGLLLAERAANGRRTVVCQGIDASCTLLGGPVPLEQRATLLLRFPVGRGRRRHVVARCRARGLPFTVAREATVMEPWSYSRVEAMLDALVGGGPDGGA